VTDVAIRVQGLSKVYRIGERQRYKSLRESIMKTLGAPLRKGNRRPPETVWALSDVSFEVMPGEVVGVIGRNGAGKSTLLKILSRITEPTRGRVEVYGRVGSLLEVGTGFHMELTGRENIYLNGAILGMKRAEIAQRFDEIVAFAEVEKFLDTPVKHYSTGMYLRLAFAVAAHLEPEILLVDEVLAVGDAAFQKKCLRKMGDAAKEGRTVFLVSHNMGAVSTLCNQVTYLVAGRLKAKGPTAEVVSAYLSELLQTESRDLAEFRLPHSGKVARFRDIQVVTGTAGNIALDEPLRFSLTLESDEDLQALTVGSSIFNSYGVCVGTLFTKESFSITSRETLILNLEVSNHNLAPGHYYAGFSVGQGGGETVRVDYDIVVGKPTFQVVPFSQSGSGVVEWQPNWGNIIFWASKLAVEKKSERP
jgi:lipopolysaccharide transport system ATP-binding protein